MGAVDLVAVDLFNGPTVVVVVTFSDTMREVERVGGVPVGVAVGVEVDTAIVMPTELQKLSAKAIISSVSSGKFTHCRDETYSVDPLDCIRSQRLGGAN